MTKAREQSAREQAARAADRSGVTIRTLSGLAELERLVDLLVDIWAGDAIPPISLEHLRALTHSGNYASGVYADESLVGGSVAFFGPPAQRTLHSDIAGIRRDARDRQVGFALKLHQRAWALGQGIETVTWTFDPLMSRNAYLNLGKLRARGVAYREDFYGAMADGINQGQGSDRLLVAWRIASDDVATACDGASLVVAAADLSAPLLLAEVAGCPVEGHVGRGAATVRVAIPADIDAVRRARPDVALTWRLAVRTTMGAELAAGGRVTGFDRRTGYVINRSERHADHAG